ncbi:hypothetical protein LI90_4321 [Carbonactinospora thermoautotrophica]|uniref:Uncharacterized protein n=1 Tax=Carbonactinospora thermoautotrophica TaxID=1469144 RepID=A0A132N011_9ACTN|nr:hypothetical protein [Carbonactinospora thermoautotrophica]KWX03195.1 hypothetical protein LI90_4246 [Carbonactinospora thermoautotrophica]KWX03270.1 hypothetical protein LI90_4321 [Carbonactinospora thermoautotrophica]MDI3332039.1 hypothetical protein [Micrococcus sp.]
MGLGRHESGKAKFGQKVNPDGRDDKQEKDVVIKDSKQGTTWHNPDPQQDDK